jgi:hypothetical protein
MDTWLVDCGASRHMTIYQDSYTMWHSWIFFMKTKDEVFYRF